MRRRSPTNSNPARDEDVRAAYMESHYYDELLPYFPTNGCGMVTVPGHPKPLSMHGTDASECHHAFGGRTGRWDKPWNLVAVCRPCHEWLEANKTMGRVLAIRLKLDQGLWDEADAHDALGFYPLGWIQGFTCRLPWVEAIRAEIVRQVEAGAIG